MTEKPRVVHLIIGLGKGGAETMLYQVIKHRTEEAPDYYVISLGLSHYYEELLGQMGVEVLELDLRKHPFGCIRRIRKELRSSDVLCCWMYISNLIGYIAGRKKVSKLIWCIRHSDLTKENNSSKTLIINRICKSLSPKIDLVTYNGKRAREVHYDYGYRPVKDVILNNGLDISEYYSDETLRRKLREELGIETDKKVILSVSKDHPIKDIPTFIKAFADLKSKRNDVIAVMCGLGLSEDNDRIRQLCVENGLEVGKDIILLGFKENVNEILNSGDVYVLHSAGEAFPNTLIQAMACEIPVVSTDVGDVVEIMGGREYIVSVGDSSAISAKINSILDMSDAAKAEMVTRNRKIVEEKYDIRNIVRSYESCYEEKIDNG